MDEDRLHELFASIGPIRVTRMFGGQGIYSEGLIVAIVVQDELMMKADADCAHAFETAGSRRWTYERQGRKPVSMPYWALPDEAYDDAAAMAHYGFLSLSAARRSRAASAVRKPRKRPAKRSPRKPDI